jgi:general stress protein 26
VRLPAREDAPEIVGRRYEAGAAEVLRDMTDSSQQTQQTQQTQQQADQQQKLKDMIKDVRLAMLTSVDPGGRLVSKPMATQDVEFDGEIWFIAERDSEKVRNIAANPGVNVAYSSSSAWVSVSGDAYVVDDQAKLAELWNTFTDAWLEGGPENPNNILIRVDATGAEYWDAPNSKVTQLLNLVKAKTTGKRFEGDNETVDLG